MKLRHSARTDVGKTRDHNEDSYGVGEGEQVEQMGQLLVVCDGMGGHAAGEVASQLAVATILSSYYGDDSDDRPQSLEQAFEQANALVYAQGRGSMGTTGVAALIHHDALHVANVGDSRAYLIRDGEIRQISRDHSFVGDQVAAGLITAEQARLSPHRNVITRALGYQADVTIDLFRMPLQIGDLILLSSDGMHGLITDAEILEIVGSMPPDQASQRLIDLANRRGGTDNITVLIARVDALDWYDDTSVDLANSDLHERVTVELPTSEVAIIEPPEPVPAHTVATVAPPAPIEAAQPAHAPATPALPQSERRLNWLGGLLALLLVGALAGIIAFALMPTAALAPGTDGTPAGSPAPTAETTPAGSPAPTLQTTPVASPAPAPTAPAPTARPTATSAARPTATVGPTATSTARPTSAPVARPTSPA